MILIRIPLVCMALSGVLIQQVFAAELTLTWVGSAGAVQYSIERETAPGTFLEIARTAAGVVSYLDLGVVPGTTYCYRVRAVGQAEYSDYSNIACGASATTAGTFTDDFSRPDGPLGNSWVIVSGNLTIKSGQARNGTAKRKHAAVSPGLVGSTQAISASFAAVDPNWGPRLGLLARYKDPYNYYACYRQTGGSSVLRISKVLNGAETMLRSLAISNPAKETFFALSCQVQGTTITLTLNGRTRLTATDATFTTGSVGLLMGSGTTGTGFVSSDRVDNVKATVQ